MSVNYFGNRSSSNGDSPFYKLKNILLPNRTNVTSGTSNTGMPIFRAAVANNVFKTPTTDAITLTSISVAGVETTVASVTTTTHLASSVAACYHLNTTDQCLYVLAYASPSYQLMKVSDSTGVLSAIGSPFTPATAANWPIAATGVQRRATMYVDGSNHIRIYYDGVYHQLNKTTGAVVSQDSAVSIGSYNLKNTAYLTASGTIACQYPTTGGVAGDQSIFFQSIHAVSSGIITEFSTVSSKIFDQRQQFSGSDISEMIRVDSDKLYFGDLGTSGNSRNLGYYNIADFDQCLQSIVDWYSGA